MKHDDAQIATTSNTTPDMQLEDQEKRSENKHEAILERFRIKDEVTESETIWCLQAVMQHLSLRSAESAVLLFKKMFPSCQVAQDMKLGKDKIGYSTVFGIGPYFRR